MENKRTLLTKEYLQFLGVQEVREDGTVIGKRGNPIAAKDNGHNYKVMGFRRSELGKPFNLYIHHIVWVWFNDTLEPDWDVHHKDKNPSNNALSNLIAMSHADHLRMHKLEHEKESTRELKCKLDRPRSFYEELLAKYEAEYIKAPELYGKSTHPKYKALIANINNTRARLRYWDSHQEEIENNMNTKTQKTLEREKIKQLRKEIEILKYLKKHFKEAGDTIRWHQFRQLEVQWATIEEKLRSQILDSVMKYCI